MLYYYIHFIETQERLRELKLPEISISGAIQTHAWEHLGLAGARVELKHRLVCHECFISLSFPLALLPFLSYIFLHELALVLCNNPWAVDKGAGG